MGNELSQHISHAQKTGVLQLKNFKLLKAPEEILQVSKTLRTLDLSSNRITSISLSIYQSLVNLKTLNLDNNRLESVPDEICYLAKLENLNLNKNFLKNLPKTINKLKNLKNVYVNSNLLADVPYELCDINLLDHVDLYHNQIEAIADRIVRMDCIELNLNNNRIHSISPEIAKCPRLKVLRLENNVLELNKIPKSLLVESKVSLLALDGNVFTQKQLQNYDGFDAYMERYTATKRKFD